MTLADPIVHHPLSYTVGPLTFTGFGVAVILATPRVGGELPLAPGPKPQARVQTVRHKDPK